MGVDTHTHNYMYTMYIYLQIQLINCVIMNLSIIQLTQSGIMPFLRLRIEKGDNLMSVVVLFLPQGP